MDLLLKDNLRYSKYLFYHYLNNGGYQLFKLDDKELISLHESLHLFSFDQIVHISKLSKEFVDNPISTLIELQTKKNNNLNIINDIEFIIKKFTTDQLSRYYCFKYWKEEGYMKIKI